VDNGLDNARKKLPRVDRAGRSAALAAVLSAPQARAELTFPPPKDLSATAENAFDPQVAVDSQDRATVV
jgi:hypothetical protein